MLPLQNIYDGTPVFNINDKTILLLYFVLKTLSFPKGSFILDLNNGSYLYNLLGKTTYPSLSEFREDIINNMINYGLSEIEARELISLIEKMDINLKYLVKDPETGEYIVQDRVNAISQPDSIPFYEIELTINGINYVAQLAV